MSITIVRSQIPKRIKKKYRKYLFYWTYIELVTSGTLEIPNTKALYQTNLTINENKGLPLSSTLPPSIKNK